MGFVGRFNDSFQNFLSGLGVIGRDKAISHKPILNLLNPAELETLYRSDWLARKIIDIPAFDATRAWRSWQAEQDQIEQLEEAERAFGIRRKMQSALVKARLYGGACLVLGVDQGRFNEELDVEAIKKGDLKFVHVVERYSISPGPVTRDITSPWFGEPQYYQRSNTMDQPPIGGVTPAPATEINNVDPDSMIFIHPSRVVRLTGLDYPDQERAPDAWGDSVLQPVYDAVRAADAVGASIAALVQRANVNVISLPGLTTMMQTDAGTTRLINRFANANVAQSVVNSILIDKDEEWNQLNVQFSQLPEVHQMYLLVACGAADIPSTRLLGREPAGQNSTGESDMRNYHDRLASEQDVKYTPMLDKLDEILIRSVFGERDPDIFYNWNPLWQMSPTEKGELAFKKAQAYKIDVDAGLIDPNALRDGRQNQLIEDGTYPGLEAALDDADAEDIDSYNPFGAPPAPLGPDGKPIKTPIGEEGDDDSTLTVDALAEQLLLTKRRRKRRTVKVKRPSVA